MDTEQLAKEISDIYLNGNFTANDPVAEIADHKDASIGSEATQKPFTSAELQEYLGSYFSGELEVGYKVAYDNSSLVVQFPRGFRAFRLKKINADHFVGPWGALDFMRDTKGRCIGFAINTDDGRLVNLRFDKVTDFDRTFAGASGQIGGGPNRVR